MKRSPKYVGLDVHQATTVIAVLDSNGRVISRRVVPTQAPALVEVCRTMRGEVHVALLLATMVGFAVAVAQPGSLPSLRHAARRRARRPASPPSMAAAWWIAGAAVVFCAGYLVGRGRR